MSVPKAEYEFPSGDLNAALEFLKRSRWELRTLRKAHVWKDRLQIIDVNGDFFEIHGIGYQDADIIPLLRAVNAAFDPKTIHEPVNAEYKELLTGRRHCWAEDRVM